MPKKRKVPTNEQVLDRIAKSACPRCGKDDGFESGDETTYDGGLNTCIGTCAHCDARWVEEYRLCGVSVDPTETEDGINAETSEESNRISVMQTIQKLKETFKMSMGEDATEIVSDAIKELEKTL